MGSYIRLDKYLAGQGIGTRSEVKNLIRRGSVSVAGECVRDFGYKLSEEKLQEGLEIFIDSENIGYRKCRYFMLNKPAGVITATEDKEKKTVMDLFPFSFSEKRKLFPVGRLDIDTEGLLLVTDDGKLAHQLLAPKKHVDKCYFVVVQGIVTEEDVLKFSEGVSGTFQTLPAELKILSTDKEKGVSETEVTIREGKYHQIKRMFHAVGKEVLYLKRLSMGSLVLDASLAPGEFRKLSEEEVQELHRYIKFRQSALVP